MIAETRVSLSQKFCAEGLLHCERQLRIMTHAAGLGRDGHGVIPRRRTGRD